MDEESKIELTIRRTIAQEIASHREFLQSQFKQIIWAIGLVVAAATVLFTYFFGKNVTETREELTARIKSEIIAYKIDEEMVKKLGEIVAQNVETQRKNIPGLVEAAFKAELKTEDLYEKIAKLRTELEESVQEKLDKQRVIFDEEIKAGTSEAYKKVRNTAGIRSPSVPSGSVMAFDLKECPDGWSDFKKGAGRVILGVGEGENGLTVRTLGDTGGTEKITLTIEEMPAHWHELKNYRSDRQDDYGFGGSERNIYAGTGAVRTSESGKGKSHDNMPPFLALRFCEKD